MQLVFKALAASCFALLFATSLVAYASTDVPTGNASTRSTKQPSFVGTACGAIAASIVDKSTFLNGGPKYAKALDDGNTTTESYTLCKAPLKYPVIERFAPGPGSYKGFSIRSEQERMAAYAKEYCRKLKGRTYAGALPGNNGPSYYPVLCALDNKIEFILTDVDVVPRRSTTFYFSIVEPVDASAAMTPQFARILAENGFRTIEHYTDAAVIAENDELDRQLAIREQNEKMKQQQVEIAKVSQVGVRVCSVDADGTVERVAPNGKIQIRARMMIAAPPRNNIEIIVPIMYLGEKLVWDDPANWRRCEGRF